MKKKIIAAVLLIMAFASCQSDDKGQSELNISIRNKFFGVDPLSINSFYQERIARQIFEGLYEYEYLKDPYEVTPLLADGMPQISDDGLVYTVKVKQGIKFSDDQCFPNGQGRELTANDVIYSLKHFTAFPPYNRAYFIYYIKGLTGYRDKAKAFLKKGGDLNKFLNANDVEGLELIDTYTLRIRLTQVCPYFLETLAVPGASIVAKEAVNYYGKDIDWHPVGTGPYILSDWGDGEKIVLTRNMNYKHGLYPNAGSKSAEEMDLLKDAGKQLPFVDKITFYYVKDDKERKTMFDSGLIDIYTPEEDYFYEYFPNGINLADKYREKGVRSFVEDNIEFNGIMFNLNEPVIGKDPDLRKALSLAFDNSKNLSVINFLSHVPAHWVIPSHIFGYDADYKNPYSEYDLKKAAEYLKRSGHDGGMKLPELVLLLRDTPALRRMGEFFAESVYKIGINVKLEYARSQEDIYEILDKKKMTVHMFFLSEFSTFSSPEKMLRLFFRGKLSYKTNYTGYYNPEYESLFEKIVVMENGPQKIKLMNRMRDMVVEDCPFIPLSFTVLYRLYHGYVHNYKPQLLMFDRYKYIRIDMNEKRRYLKNL